MILSSAIPNLPYPTFSRDSLGSLKQKKNDRQTRRGISRIRAYCIYLREICVRSVFVDRPAIHHRERQGWITGESMSRNRGRGPRESPSPPPSPSTLAPCRITRERSRNLRAVRAARKCIASANLWRRSKRRSVQKPIAVNCCADRRESVRTWDSRMKSSHPD